MFQVSCQQVPQRLIVPNTSNGNLCKLVLHCVHNMPCMMNKINLCFLNNAWIQFAYFPSFYDC
jgi:hypothetical protein